MIDFVKRMEQYNINHGDWNDILGFLSAKGQPFTV